MAKTCDQSGNGGRCVNKVTLLWVRLVLGWMAVFRWANHLVR